MVILNILYQLTGGFSVPLDDDIWFYVEPELVLVNRYMIMGENKEKMYEGVWGRYAIIPISDCYLLEIYSQS